jgi:signal peptidase I, bacterial type
MPTLLAGDFILVNKFEYGIRLPVINKKIIDLDEPKRGDVVVFRFPNDPSVDYIKRVVGLPGDHIAYRNKVLYINDGPAPQVVLGPYQGPGTEDSSGTSWQQLETLGDVKHGILIQRRHLPMNFEIVVPQGHYFVMGDNRDRSNDSRFWGSVPEENLVGKAFMRWMNWDCANSSLCVDWSRIGDSIE